MFLFLGVLRRKFLSFSIKTNPARPESNVFIAINNFAQNLFMQAFAQAYHNKLLKDKEIICVEGKTERGTVLENGCKRYTRRSTHTQMAQSWDTAKLGTGCQSPARQDQTAHEQGSAQSQYNTQNNLHCVLHLEKAPKEEGRQEKRNGRDYATHNSRINKTGRLLIRIKKK